MDVLPQTVNGKWTLANTIVTLFTGALLWLAGFMLNATLEFRDFMAAGERFTRAEALELKNEIRTELKSELPPPWLTQRIDMLKADHGKIEKKFDKLEERLARIEAQIR